MNFIFQGRHGPVAGAVVGFGIAVVAAFLYMEEFTLPTKLAVVALTTIGGVVAGLLLWLFDHFSGTTSCPDCGRRKWPSQLVCLRCSNLK
jgi:hypothetical protein